MCHLTHGKTTVNQLISLGFSWENGALGKRHITFQDLPSSSDKYLLLLYFIAYLVQLGLECSGLFPHFQGERMGGHHVRGRSEIEIPHRCIR